MSEPHQVPVPLRLWLACEQLAKLLARERGITVTPEDIAALAIERGLEKLLKGRPK